MLFAVLFSWETLVVILCLLILASGLVRITMRRQTEILKEYLQPEQLRVEQLVMRARNTPSSGDMSGDAENATGTDSQKAQGTHDNS